MGDAEVSYLCGKRTLEGWRFYIDRRDKTLEITSNTDGLRMKVKIIDTEGGRYAILLETQKKMPNVLYLEYALGDELGVLFLEDKEKEL